jgi:hypothetical protein
LNAMLNPELDPGSEKNFPSKDIAGTMYGI